MSDKFYDMLMKKIQYTQEIISKIKKEKNKEQKKQYNEELTIEMQEISNFIIGKMHNIWAEIERMPNGEEKDYEIFKYNSLIDDIENIFA